MASFALLIAYFGWQALARVMVSPGVELDEAEQLVLTQKLAWGYGAQAPLFTWVQYLVFAVTGPSVAGLAILKNTLLAITYFCTYWSTRLITGRHPLALLAALSLLFVPQISWESQRDLTHTVLASTLASATVLTFVLLMRRPRVGWYVLLGAVSGLGMLAKYNYGIFLAALLLAGGTISSCRRVLLNVRMLFTVAAMGLVVGPHGWWAWQNPGRVTSALHKLSAAPELSGVSLLAVSLTDLVVSAGLLIAPLTALYLVACWRARARGGLGTSSHQVMNDVLRRQLIVIVVGALICGGAGWITNFKDRWFQPMVIGLPVLLAGVLASRLDAIRLRRLTWSGFAVATVLVVLVPMHLRLSELRDRPFRLNAPFAELVAKTSARIESPKVVFAEDRWIGGNLRLSFPHATIVVPELPTQVADLSPDRLAVWNATRRLQAPVGLANHYREMTGVELPDAEVAVVEAPYRHHPSAVMRLAFAGEVRRVRVAEATCPEEREGLMSTRK